MTLTDLFLSQLIDPFRIGLLIALVLTAGRTRGVVGLLAPLGLGVVFVAVLIPLTLVPVQGAAFWTVAGVGIAANLVILAVIMAVQAMVLRLRG
jgi:hypothetical protein